MNTIRILSLVMSFTILLFSNCFSQQLFQKGPNLGQQPVTYTLSIPVRGNCWFDGDYRNNRELVTGQGIRNWTDASAKARVWFRTEEPGEFDLGMTARIISGKSGLKVTAGSTTWEMAVAGNAFDTIPLGKFNALTAGYQCIEIEGTGKTGPVFAEIESLFLGGSGAKGKVSFVRDDFYWGRRGPSVHLNYQVPESSGPVAWFYNEITVPEGNDVPGSYFMANGFAFGYFGIQVNSDTERRILFSVWSPFKTDNPKDIPENAKIVLLRKGENVNTGEFGNEGSGGQSFLRFNWKAGNTYRFLLRAEPSESGYTDFTAWFYAPESGKWLLIAGFRRPQTNSYLMRLYSFLENFIPETGNITRKGYFGNQWICSPEGNWTELTRIKFTADATARKESRLDYAGGSEGNLFFLKNCGFFSEKSTIDCYFERKSNGVIPPVKFNDLP